MVESGVWSERPSEEGESDGSKGSQSGRTDDISFEGVVPPYIHNAPTLDVAVSCCYLREISQGNMKRALMNLADSKQTKGLSPLMISCLKTCWNEEYQHWRESSLGGEEWVCLWVDGIHTTLRGAHGETLSCRWSSVSTFAARNVFSPEDGIRELAERGAGFSTDCVRGLRMPRLVVAYYRDRFRKISPAALEWLALRRELDPFVVSAQLAHAVERLHARRRRTA